MADKTAIEWTDATWNPTTGCDRVSPGCDHCYAMTLAKRLKGMGSKAYQEDGDPATSGPGFLAHEWPGALGRPLGWHAPRRIFVNSMSDLFHKSISDEYIRRVWTVMEMTPQHTYQVLTKRPGRMASFLRRYRPEPLPNVWGGTSVEDQHWATVRIPPLKAAPLAIRFLSCEPLLGPVNLFASTDSPLLDWVIVGGESGPGARPMHSSWARHLRDQCIRHEVPFLFKQWGGKTPKSGGRVLDGRTWDEYPERVA